MKIESLSPLLYRKGVIVHFCKRDFDERAFRLNRVLVIQILHSYDIAAGNSTVLFLLGTIRFDSRTVVGVIKHQFTLLLARSVILLFASVSADFISFFNLTMTLKSILHEYFKSILHRWSSASSKCRRIFEKPSKSPDYMHFESVVDVVVAAHVSNHGCFGER